MVGAGTNLVGSRPSQSRKFAPPASHQSWIIYSNQVKACFVPFLCVFLCLCLFLLVLLCVRQLLPVPHAQSLGDVSVRMLSIPPQRGSAPPSQLSRCFSVTKPSCHCPRALCSSSDRGMGIGELHFQVRYKICGALFLSRHSPGHFPAVRMLLLPHISLLPYL